jgi:hypothetical protein
MTRDEARRIAANIAELREMLGGRAMRDEATAVRSRRLFRVSYLVQISQG